MKIVVFSDSHGSARTIAKALSLHHNTADMALFAGDGISDFLSLGSLYPSIPFYAVLGNCDGMTLNPDGNAVPYELTLDICRHKLFLTHGHRFQVKLLKTPLIRTAVQNGADIVIFGHTHARYSKYIPKKNDDIGVCSNNAVYLFNPGAASAGSYGIIDIRENGVLMSHGSADDFA